MTGKKNPRPKGFLPLVLNKCIIVSSIQIVSNIIHKYMSKWQERNNP